MSAARPLARTTTVVIHVLRLAVWGVQALTAAAYFAVIAQPDAWRSVYATTTADTISTLAALPLAAVFWAASLYTEQKRFYDRKACRDYRRIGLAAHALLLAVALGVMADQHQWAVMLTVLTTCTLPAVLAWHAWMRSLALPPEDQAVVDAILNQKARKAAAVFDATRKELHRERLRAVVTGLGYQMGDATPESAVTEEPATAARIWRIPPRKHQPLVYLLRNGNRVKIGTTTELKRRIRTLALRPENVVLLLDGGQQLERELHRKFAGLRIGTTEWFAYDGSLIDFVHTESTRATQKGGSK